MSVTIEDISRQLGISVSTVSKALNNYPDVAPDTRERVLAAARLLDYHPSAAARNLRRGRSDKVGLLVNNPIAFLSEYISQVIAGAALSAEPHGNNLILYTSVVANPQKLRRICRAREVDGLILIYEPSVNEIAVLQQESMPFIVFGRRLADPSVSFVAPNNEDGARQLTAHLIAQGHTRIGFTTRPQLGTVSEDRYAGYRQGLREAGIAFDSDLIIETAVRPRTGRMALETLLQLPVPPTALFAFYDLMAVDAAQLAQERGLRIPEDIAIAGFDGLPSSMIATPQITTVVQPLTEMGREAMEILARGIETGNQAPVQLTFPTTLVVRDSTLSFATKSY